MENPCNIQRVYLLFVGFLNVLACPHLNPENYFRKSTRSVLSFLPPTDLSRAFVSLASCVKTCLRLSLTAMYSALCEIHVAAIKRKAQKWRQTWWLLYVRRLFFTQILSLVSLDVFEISLDTLKIEAARLHCTQAHPTSVRSFWPNSDLFSCPQIDVHRGNILDRDNLLIITTAWTLPSKHARR